MLTNLFKDKYFCIEMQDYYKRAFEDFEKETRAMIFGSFTDKQIFSSKQIRANDIIWSNFEDMGTIYANIGRLEIRMNEITNNKFGKSNIYRLLLRDNLEESGNLKNHIQNIFRKINQDNLSEMFFSCLKQDTQIRDCFTIFCPSLPDIISNIEKQQDTYNYNIFLKNPSIENAKKVLQDMENILKIRRGKEYNIKICKQN